MELMRWRAERQADLGDKQIEDDLEAGRLNAMLIGAEKEYKVGLTKPL